MIPFWIERTTEEDTALSRFADSPASVHDAEYAEIEEYGDKVEIE
ncbi:hypothetical protein ABN584_26790 [Gloeocapsa sp. BRSZ]